MTSQPFSLTEHLLSSSPDSYRAATQSPFLLAAAEGRLPKPTLGRWLANDRLYIHSYIRAAAQTIAALDLPQAPPPNGEDAPVTRFLDWLLEALAAVRKEEKMFLDVAARYGIGVDLAGTAAGAVDGENKLAGLVMIEDLFGTIGDSSASTLRLAAAAGARRVSPPPWLDAALMFWGTERCYLDAWSWAKSRQPMSTRGSEARKDADGGALRKEFIPNWSSAEFAQFVGKLGGLIDEVASKAVDGVDEESRDEFLKGVEGRWKSLLAAEAAFWPEVV